MKIVGNVPKTVVYFYGGQSKAGFKWDGDDTVTNSVSVIPAYCSDAENEKTRQTGISWATSYRCGSPKTHTEFERPNDPISNIQIVSLEIRSEGGRAWKVVTPDNYYFDLREDVLLDIMQNSSIIKGVIKCALLWCKVGSEMKLVRVDSELHKAAIESGKLKETKPISNPEPGVIYQMRNGDSLVFLGNVKGTKISEDGWGKPTSIPFTGQIWLDLPSYDIKDKVFIDASSFFKDKWSSSYGTSSSILGLYLKMVKKASVVSESVVKTDITFDKVKAEINSNADKCYRDVINAVNLV